MRIVVGKVVDLRPHPTERRWAGSQPSYPPSESGGGSRPLEKGEVGEVVEVGVERDQEDPVQHCSLLLGKAKPGTGTSALRYDDGIHFPRYRQSP